MEQTAGSDRGLAAARALLADLPKLHDWGRGLEVGGLNQRIGERLLEEVGRYDAPRILETGAGASTLLFCTLEPERVTTIAPDPALQARMMHEARARNIATDCLRFLCERSELALPRLAVAGESVDLALIDGHHGWPTVFVDFCYINMMLGDGATLFVDDVQLYSVGQLALLLNEQEDFELVGIDDKLATYRKVGDRKFLPEWRAEPFIERLTAAGPSAVVELTEAARR